MQELARVGALLRRETESIFMCLSAVAVLFASVSCSQPPEPGDGEPSTHFASIERGNTPWGEAIGLCTRRIFDHSIEGPVTFWWIDSGRVACIGSVGMPDEGLTCLLPSGEILCQGILSGIVYSVVFEKELYVYGWTNRWEPPWSWGAEGKKLPVAPWLESGVTLEVWLEGQAAQGRRPWQPPSTPKGSPPQLGPRASDRR